MSSIKPLNSEVKKLVAMNFGDSVKTGVGIAIGFFVFYSIVLPAALCAGLILLAMMGYSLPGR